MKSDDFIEFIKKRCEERLSGITDTTGVWSFERGQKEVCEDILRFIEIYNEKYNENRPNQAV